MEDKNNEPTYHPEEYDNAQKEGRFVSVSRLFRYDHLNHNIPIGAVVKFKLEKYYHHENIAGNITIEGTGYVNGHHRDCDGTPLYSVCDFPVIMPKDFLEVLRLKMFVSFNEHGISESDLTVIDDKPTEMLEFCEFIEKLRI